MDPFTEAVHATIKAEAVGREGGLRQLSLDSGLGREGIRGRIYKKRPFDTDEIADIARALAIDLDTFIGLIMERVGRDQ